MCCPPVKMLCPFGSCNNPYRVAYPEAGSVADFSAERTLTLTLALTLALGVRPNPNPNPRRALRRRSARANPSCARRAPPSPETAPPPAPDRALPPVHGLTLGARFARGGGCHCRPRQSRYENATAPPHTYVPTATFRSI